ncbi:helix-turn-helix domain-containing protein [Maribacter litoralis]|uniref:helix-turn-helix domain-containing protein n=1 Tax=Maribacter litoralis TaxID=2059726 RepID=UPI000E31D6D7|nr:helix-turn-helix domain-containing protein [Maribacter litoralis]
MHAVFNTKSIAVLPFKNIGSTENDYFSDGISEEIINALTKINGLKVTARTSSFFYKNKSLDARHIGNELGVETLLEGSVRIIKERVRITAQLIRTDNGFHMWSENFDRELTDIFELQDEISLLIADKIRENFGHFELQEHLVASATNNIEAYKLFLKGRSFQLNWRLEDINTAITYYEQSVVIDPLFADAYVGIGWCYGILASWQYINHKEGIAKAAFYLDKGVGLNPTSHVGHFGKATISFWGNWLYNEGLSYLEKCLNINPKYTEALEAKSEILTSLGKFTLAKTTIDLALEINPLSPNHHYTKGNIYYLQGDFDNAIISLDVSLKIDPTFVLAMELKTACYIHQNNYSSFIRYIEINKHLERPNLCKKLFDLVNRSNHFENQNIGSAIDVKNENSTHLPWNFYILIHEDKNSALNTLKHHTELKTGQFINFYNDPFLAPLRQLPNYKDLVSELFSSTVLPSNIEKGKSNNSETPFEGEELNDFATALENTMTNSKRFCNPELSLKQLAYEINLHPNKLSWLLNNHFGKNFNDFINHYRIREFQQLAVLPENKHITLLGLAYDSGFNSKTVFNTFFKKETGTTPKQWVKANL